MSSFLLCTLLQALSLSQGFNITDDLHPQNVTELDHQPTIELSTLHLSQGCSGVLRVRHVNNTMDVTLNLLDTQEQNHLANQICENLGCGLVHAVNATVCSGACLADCILKESTLHNCTTAAEGDCTNATEVICEQQAVRLVGGRDRCVGRVELLYTGQWGTVCDDEFDVRSGHVVCAQLGCGSLKKLAMFGAGSGPIYISQMKCIGTERNLWECRVNNTTPADYCGHKEDAGIVCSESTELTHTTSNTTYLLFMTTESAAVVAMANSRAVSPAVIGCCILSVVLLLFVLINATVFVHFKRRKACEIQQRNSDEQTYTETGTYNSQPLATAAMGTYNSQPLTTAAMGTYNSQLLTAAESLGPRSSSNYGQRFVRGTSHSSHDSDYEQHHSDRVQQLNRKASPAVNVDDSSSTSSGEGYENSKAVRKFGVKVPSSHEKSLLTPLAHEDPKFPGTHSQAVYLSDSSSTSSGEFYTNTKTGMDKMLQSGEQTSFQEETPLIPTSHGDQHFPATDSHAVNVNDVESTSSGEDYQNIDMDNNLQSEDEEETSLSEKSHQMPHDTQTGNTQASYSTIHRPAVDDTASTSSDECYQNTEILDASLQSGNKSPSETPQNHHSTQTTGSEDHHVPSNLSQEMDNSSTSSENSYVNVPPKTEQNERRSPEDDQFSSGSDYDEPENW